MISNWGHNKGKKDDTMRRVRVSLKILALFVICAMPVFLLKATASPPKTIEVLLKVEDSEILQGEQMPEFKVDASIQGRTDTVLDRESGYTIQDMLDELKNPASYTVHCDADTAVEGTYPIEVSVKNDQWKKWAGKVSINTQGAELKVKNAVGEWEDTRFRRYDGTYVTDDFVVSMGDTYYFNSEGNKVTGWQQIQDGRYFFEDTGILARSCWKVNGDSQSYVDENGRAVLGWQTIGEKKYYFDENGLMATGEVTMGMVTYKFAEDGSLESQKVTGIDANRPMVALTFDDGPGKRTGELLAKLEEYHAHATFFMLGQKVPSYPEEVKKMKEIGCELGNHSYDHADLGKADAAKIREEVGGMNSKVASIIGENPTVMRPPYGSISSTLRENVGMPMILWNIDTLDWKTRNAQATIDAVMSKVKDGDIILMHDIHSETIDAALELIPKLQEAGYQLVTVSELAAAKGVTLENGGKYTDF